MDLLVTVSKKESATILKPLLEACGRSNCRFEVFLTHHGVRVLNDNEITALLNEVSDNSIACHDSWVKHTAGEECPVTLGSQTNHSEMMARAKRVISL